jgi:hypothetical protein
MVTERMSLNPFILPSSHAKLKLGIERIMIEKTYDIPLPAMRETYRN